MMMGILSRLGLTKPANPPATIDPIGWTDWEGKFKKAAADLADSAFRIEALEFDLKAANKDADEWKGAAMRSDEAVRRLEAEIAELTPLADAARRRRANDANRVRPSRSKKVDAPAAAKPAPKAKAVKKAVSK